MKAEIKDGKEITEVEEKSAPHDIRSHSRTAEGGLRATQARTNGKNVGETCLRQAGAVATTEETSEGEILIFRGRRASVTAVHVV